MPSAAVELLYFEGCPNVEKARALVEKVAGETGVALELELIEITSPEDVDRMRFLGSPSVRVNGHDVEPGADDRETFMYACRVYRTNSGLSSQPAKEWIRAALSAP